MVDVDINALQNLLGILYFVIGALVVFILGLIILMLVSGYWFIFGIKSKWKRAKGFGLARIFNPDNLEQQYWVDFKRPMAQIPGEKAAYFFNHKFTTRFKGIRIANFNRDEPGQLDVRGNSEVVTLNENEEPETYKTFWESIQFWKKERSGIIRLPFWRKWFNHKLKVEIKIEKFNVLAQIDVLRKNANALSPSQADTIYTEIKQIARQEAESKQTLIYILLFLIIIGLVVSIFFDANIRNLVLSLIQWASTKSNMVIL